MINIESLLYIVIFACFFSAIILVCIKSYIDLAIKHNLGNLEKEIKDLESYVRNAVHRILDSKLEEYEKYIKKK